MGTPEFAAHILQDLIDSNYPVLAVVTAPDRPAGRGLKLKASAVAQTAERNNLPVLKPEKLRNPEFLEDLKAFNAEVFVVIAFRMLPELVWSMPAKGTFNLHASLLPQYRGAAPIHWAIINGEQTTGLSTFFIDKQIDTGDTIQKLACGIDQKDTVGSLHDKLMNLGCELTKSTLDAIGENTATRQKQHIEEGETLKAAPKLFRPQCHINFNRPVMQVYNHIRGLNPFPGAFAILKQEGEKDRQVKFFDCWFEEKQSKAIGSWFVENEELKVACVDGNIILKSLQLEGKKRMKAVDFIRGFNCEEGQVFG